MAATLGFLVAADLLGVAACFLFDVFGSERATSGALYYAIWFVLGVFCGVFIYSLSDAFTSPETKGSKEQGDHGRAAVLVITSVAIVLTCLSVLFYRFDWRYSHADSVYVPDSESHTLTFFITILITLILANRTLAPEPKKKR